MEAATDFAKSVDSAANWNPPRRAKRPRSDSGAAESAPSYTPRMRPAFTQDETVPSPDSSSGDADDDFVPSAMPSPKRRGRKASTANNTSGTTSAVNGSRAAREAQRKLNHSVIEKARRTKINDALATLRELVPAHYKVVDEDEEAGGRAGKEFKLDILVRTVSYMQDLTKKVALLERQQKGGKSQRTFEDEDEMDKDTEMDSIDGEIAPAAAFARSRSQSATRLPSIFSWLPPNQAASRKMQQLPSPPASTHVAPTAPSMSSSRNPPPLELPSAGTSSAYTSPAISAIRSTDDVGVAGLLLEMRSSSTSPNVSPRLDATLRDELHRHIKRMERSTVREGPTDPRLPMTPAHMLGMGQYRNPGYGRG